MAYKSEEAFQLERIIDCSRIAVQDFDGFKKASIAQWVHLHTQELISYCLAEMISLQQEAEMSASLPDHVKQYLNITEAEQIINEIRAVGHLRNPLSGVVYFATHYDNCSCHDLLFRCSYPATMSRRAERFLHLASQLSPAQLSRLKLQLKRAELHTHSLLHVLQQRLQELSIEAGIELGEMVSSSKYPLFSRNILLDFVENPIHPDGHTDGMKPSRISTLYMPLFTMLCTTCISYKVNADRLLLLDYSDIAVFADGSKPSPELQELLSCFLRADPLAQDIAIQTVLVSLMDR